jgi:hypothetical protein
MLAGCKDITGELDEGDTPVYVKVKALPKNMDILPSSLSTKLDVSLTLTNVATEKMYFIHANGENGFVGKATLNPGTYRVSEPFNSSYELFDFTPKTKESNVKLTRGKDTVIEVEITDLPKLEAQIVKSQPTEEIKNADLFSRKIQMEGKVFLINDILKADISAFKKDTEVEGLGVSVKNGLDSTVEVGATATISGYGISVTAYNDKEEQQKLRNCKVMRISFGKDLAILGGGLRIGLDAGEITDPEKGILGKPDKCTGSFMLGWDVDRTGIIYLDENTGDKVDINLGSHDYHVSGIEYSLELYEEGK